MFPIPALLELISMIPPEHDGLGGGGSILQGGREPGGEGGTSEEEILTNHLTKSPDC